jgi:hypothetical protein
MAIYAKYYAQIILAVVRKNYVFKLFFNCKKIVNTKKNLGNVHPARVQAIMMHNA